MCLTEIDAFFLLRRRLNKVSEVFHSVASAAQTHHTDSHFSLFTRCNLVFWSCQREGGREGEGGSRCRGEFSPTLPALQLERWLI